jgi:hypothetical protein
MKFDEHKSQVGLKLQNLNTAKTKLRGKSSPLAGTRVIVSMRAISLRPTSPYAQRRLKNILPTKPKRSTTGHSFN